jgi:hypothetical protein
MNAFKFALAGAALAFAATAASAAPAQSPLMAPIHQFIDGLNKGDVKAAAASHVASPAIVDEFPPHFWQGPGAFQTWAADFQKDGEAHGLTDETMTLGAPVRTDISGDNGYAVVHGVFTFKQAGKPMNEPGQFAFALHKEAAGWKITGWGWAGGIPRPAAAAAKPK